MKPQTIDVIFCPVSFFPFLSLHDELKGSESLFRESVITWLFKSLPNNVPFSQLRPDCFLLHWTLTDWYCFTTFIGLVIHRWTVNRQLLVLNSLLNFPFQPFMFLSPVSHRDMVCHLHEHLCCLAQLTWSPVSKETANTA